MDHSAPNHCLHTSSRPVVHGLWVDHNWTQHPQNQIVPSKNDQSYLKSMENPAFQSRGVYDNYQKTWNHQLFFSNIISIRIYIYICYTYTYTYIHTYKLCHNIYIYKYVMYNVRYVVYPHDVFSRGSQPTRRQQPLASADTAPASPSRGPAVPGVWQAPWGCRGPGGKGCQHFMVI